VEQTTTGWLPPGPVVVGLTAGASTPNSIIGEVVARLEQLAGDSA
jgi:4-hydroxy-3-methylbut-2-enyl diphosphate reductase